MSVVHIRKKSVSVGTTAKKKQEEGVLAPTDETQNTRRL